MMIEKTPKPARSANQISQVLNTVYGVDRFPVDVQGIAFEWSSAKYPYDKITLIKGAALGEFEGGLYKAPENKVGWGIIYNNEIESEGRINFTIAHEFGHYLMHRNIHPDNFECTTTQTLDWDSKLGQIEAEANKFAATLLMPLDDYRKQIPEHINPDINQISLCSERYGVSLTAAILRWLDYTTKAAMVIASRDGFILWSRSSKKAMSNYCYFKVSGMPPIQMPMESLVFQNTSSVELKSDGVWFNSICTEKIIVSDKYDFTLSILNFH